MRSNGRASARGGSSTLSLALVVALVASATTALAAPPRPFGESQRGRFDGNTTDVKRSLSAKPGEKIAFLIVVAGGKPGKVPARAAMSLHVDWRSRGGVSRHAGSFPCRAICGWVFEGPSGKDASASGDYVVTVHDDSPTDVRPIFDWTVTAKRGP